MPAANYRSTTMASVDLSTSPWLIRVFDRVPLSLPVMGILIALVHYLFIAVLAHMLAPGLANAAYRLWQGELPIVALQIVKSIMVGYVLAAGYYGLRGAVRDFESL